MGSDSSTRMGTPPAEWMVNISGTPFILSSSAFVKSGDAGHDNVALGGASRGHANDQARRGNDAIVCSEDSRAHPADAGDQMTFVVIKRSGHDA